VARILTAPITRALIVESPHVSLDDRLREIGIEPVRVDKLGSEDELIGHLLATGAQVLFKRSRVLVTRRVVESAPALQLVQLCCIGDDSVDKVACADHGVLVCNDPVSNGRSVVELAVAHMIALSRRLYETDAHTHANQWDKSESERWEVLGKRVGVVGLGNIGRQVAKISEQLGMEVHFYDSRLVAQEVGVEMGWHLAPDLEALFRRVDIITTHVSATDAWGNDNTGLLDPVLAHLGAERPERSPRVFLNLARGNIHSSDALLAAVNAGKIRRAAVDVYPEEPSPGAPAWHNPYADQPRIACTPHIGAATQEAQPRIARRVVDTVGRFARQGALRDCVFAPRVDLAVPNLRPGNAVLAVVHGTVRGTKKAIDDAIYEAGASNLGSAHCDFDNGVAYDLSVLDRPLPPEELDRLVSRAAVLAGDPNAIRAVRQVVVQA
jgi:D-3-phosphoglycerate dehydrogenase